MRVLVNALVLTHFMPMVPLTWALRAAGHEVVCAGKTDIVEAAHTAGLATRHVGADDVGATKWAKPLVKKSPFTAAGSGSKLPDQDKEPPWKLMGQRWENRVRTYAHEYLEFARQWQADLIITDPLEFGGLVVGGALGIPTVYHRWGIDNFTTSLQPHAKEALHELCVELGAPGLPDPAMIIDPCPRSVQSPNVSVGAPERFIPYNGNGAVADWATRPTGGRRRICVAFGAWGTGRLAEDGDLGPVVESIGRAVDEVGGDIETLLLMPDEFRDKLGTVWPTIRIVDQMPINLGMRDCDVMVHHGGSGTALTAIAYGVPQLVLAQDGPLLVPNAERVEASGAGRAITDEAQRNDPDVIKAALVEVLTDPRFRETAETIRDEMAAMPSPAALVSRLETLATS